MKVECVNAAPAMITLGDIRPGEAFRLECGSLAWLSVHGRSVSPPIGRGYMVGLHSGYLTSMDLDRRVIPLAPSGGGIKMVDA